MGQMEIKKIVSALPEADETQRPKKTRGRDSDGGLFEIDQEVGRYPLDKKQWEKQIKIYAHTILMVWDSKKHDRRVDCGLFRM